MTETMFADDEDPFERELFFDELNEWEMDQLVLDRWAEEEEEDIDPDLYDQYEYMLDHQNDE